jgi:epoxyqueuosine reductase
MMFAMIDPQPDLQELARAIKEWGAELGFAEVRIADVDLSGHEPGLQAWLDAATMARWIIWQATA